jgi:hypothetical protein
LGGTVTVCWTFELEHYKKKKLTQNVDAALLHFKHNHAKEISVPHVHTESFTINLQVWKVSSMLPLDADQIMQ